MATTVHEPARETPVAHECDLCVVGGSCTGIFAAVRAARLGLAVCVVEQNSIFGGSATAAQVNEWHSLLDAEFEQQIIGGLTAEVVERMRRRNAIDDLPLPGRIQFRFNSAEMAAELDQLVTEYRIRPFLRAICVGGIREGDRLSAILIEDKSGRRAIRARFFIDASGDGDLIRRAGFEAYKSPALQPVTYQAMLGGTEKMMRVSGFNWRHFIAEHGERFNYPRDNGFPWVHALFGVPGVANVYGPRNNGVDASDADQLTQALLDGRRWIRTLNDMSRAVHNVELPVISWAHALGVRETWHAKCRHTLSVHELLSGVRFEDGVINGTYPVDVHHPGGTILRYLDGREEIVNRDGSHYWRRWRGEDVPTPSCYQVPYRSLVLPGAANLLVAGRLLDADREAFGGVRVMVNMNQTGEAVGVASAVALRTTGDVRTIDTHRLRQTLADGGSLAL